MTVRKQWFVIVNPAAGLGKVKRLWPTIASQLNAHNFEFVHAFTEPSSHGKLLVQRAIKDGFRHFICVGGDGTVHTVVNGIMSQDEVHSHDVRVGVIPVGTGNDWAKTYHIPRKTIDAIRLIKDGLVYRQDIGRMDFITDQSGAVYFNNLAGVGFDGYVVSKVTAYKHLGTFAYLYGALLGMLSFKNFQARITCGDQTFKGRFLMIVLGICRYSGGGMQLTHTPHPSDGLFDVSMAENFGVLDLIKNVFRLFNGTVFKSHKIQVCKTSRVTVETNDDAPIEADGELVGTGSFSVVMCPKAISFYINKKDQM